MSRIPLEIKFATLSERFRARITNELIPLTPFDVEFTFKGIKEVKSFTLNDISVALDTVCPAVGTKNHKIQIDNLVQMVENIGFEIGLSSSPLRGRFKRQ